MTTKIFKNKKLNAVAILKSKSIEYFYTHHEKGENYDKIMLPTVEEWLNMVEMLEGSGFSPVRIVEPVQEGE